VGGNLLALFQNHVKRMLAYSSIAHLGYLLVAFMAGGRAAVGAVAFYLVAYAATIMGCFAVVAVLSGKEGDADHLSTYRGLFFRHPWLGSAFALMLLSLAGIPLTAGFIGKFILVAAGAGSDLWWLVTILVLTSGIGLFYYLRVIVTIFGQSAPEARDVPGHATQPAAMIGAADAVVLAATTLALLFLGVFPGPLLDFIYASLKLMG
jgi:NADH-quinone oxidoreductase subunit N